MLSPTAQVSHGRHTLPTDTWHTVTSQDEAVLAAVLEFGPFFAIALE